LILASRPLAIGRDGAPLGGAGEALGIAAVWAPGVEVASGDRMGSALAGGPPGGGDALV